jgi:hypothetical protein
MMVVPSIGRGTAPSATLPRSLTRASTPPTPLWRTAARTAPHPHGP